MSSTSSCSDSIHSSDDSDVYYLTNYEIEADPIAFESDHEGSTSEESSQSTAEDNIMCLDDPVADQEWTAQYESEIREITEQEEKLKARLDGTTKISEWCKCGNCNVESLQNISESYCCRELEHCVEAMGSDLVLQDLPQGVELTCITGHPGFNPVCLQKWSLRLASWKYKTKESKRYQQTGSEESFLRSVSYREFVRLVYGVLGTKRIPLPACAYAAIRKQFPDSSEHFTGYEMDTK